MVFNGDSAVLSIATNQLPVGVGASSPAVKLEPLLKAPSALGLLSPASVLSINSQEEKAPNAFVGCGYEE
jgi:hypothetical protein